MFCYGLGKVFIGRDFWVLFWMRNMILLGEVRVLEVGKIVFGKV